MRSVYSTEYAIYEGSKEGGGWKGRGDGVNRGGRRKDALNTMYRLVDTEFY